MNKEAFVVVEMNTDKKILVMYIVALGMLIIMSINYFSKAQVVLLTSIEIIIKYFNFFIIFCLDIVV